jgi:hypothetical protein
MPRSPALYHARYLPVMFPAAAASNGVSLGHSWLPDGCDEARDGVSTGAR